MTCSGPRITSPSSTDSGASSVGTAGFGRSASSSRIPKARVTRRLRQQIGVDCQMCARSEGVASARGRICGGSGAVTIVGAVVSAAPGVAVIGAGDDHADVARAPPGELTALLPADPRGGALEQRVGQLDAFLGRSDSKVATPSRLAPAARRARLARLGWITAALRRVDFSRTTY
jgi:hypothetical protein